MNYPTSKPAALQQQSWWMVFLLAFTSPLSCFKMADLSSRNMRFKGFMLCRNTDLGPRGADPCSWLSVGLEQRHVLWHTVTAMLPPACPRSCEAWGCPGMGTPPWHVFLEVASQGKSVSNTVIQCQQLQCHLILCGLDCQLSTREHGSLIAPCSGTQGAQFPLMESMNRRLNTACVKAGA